MILKMNMLFKAYLTNISKVVKFAPTLSARRVQSVALKVDNKVCSIYCNKLCHY